MCFFIFRPVLDENGRALGLVSVSTHKAQTEHAHTDIAQCSVYTAQAGGMQTTVQFVARAGGAGAKKKIKIKKTKHQCLNRGYWFEITMVKTTCYFINTI